MPSIRHLALALLLALIAPGARAGTSTASLAVSATVTADCRITAPALTFPNYVSGQAANADVAINLAYTGCIGSSLVIGLNGGANDQTSSRGMKSTAGAILRYQLYRDAARTSGIGSGSAGISLTADTSGSGNVPVYGRIPNGQAVAPGTYSDTVAITLTF